MRRHERSWMGLLGLGLLASAAGCSSGDGDGLGGERPFGPSNLSGSKTGLQRAASCTDLLTKIQDDAIAKLDLTVAQYKESYASWEPKGGILPPGSVRGADAASGGTVGFAPPSNAANPGQTADGVASGGGTGGSEVGGGGAIGAETPSPDPIGASETNTQVKGVDEADFVKLVDSGKGMFLLHGNTLRKLKTYPAEELSLEPASLVIEGQPSELFVTEQGKAVVFSSVYGYSTGSKVPAGDSFGGPAIDFCGPEYCGGGGYGGTLTKITIADVSSATFTTERELYYEGNYISSRRYDDVVRVVLQAETSYANLYSPNVTTYDSFGRPYPQQQIDQQLEQWRERTASDIRTTKLGDWLPLVQEAKDGKLVDVAPACDSYFVPQPGLSAFGLTHVLSLDVSKSGAPVGGVTVLGQSSTVYSNLERMVLAQPDYRWQTGLDFGFIDEQRTSLHVFELAAADTDYLASGWVSGQLPQFNSQFGLDVAADHTLRVVTTGRSRKNPEAEPGTPEFWEQAVENRLYTLQERAGELAVVGKSENLGHHETGETVHSARFVGNRAYVVTFRQTDPLIALDVADAAHPTVLGQIEIPGFSQYMHPLDENHLITFGVSGTRGQQLQLFDVSNPSQAIPQPKVLDLGFGGWSELANNHKAFTFYAKQGLIALPVSGSGFDTRGVYRAVAGLQVIKVDAEQGFTALGSIDHSVQYTAQGCYVCNASGCFEQCSTSVEMRRGHFVETADTTYVYGISYAAVSVSDIADLTTPVQTAVLPQLATDQGPWYGTTGISDGGIAPRDAGVISIAPQPGFPQDGGVAMAAKQ